MAPTNKTNFKGNDVQARLLRAIVAAHPDVKWNYKGKSFVFPFSFLPGSSVCLSASLPRLSYHTGPGMLVSCRPVNH